MELIAIKKINASKIFNTTKFNTRMITIPLSKLLVSPVIIPRIITWILPDDVITTLCR